MGVGVLGGDIPMRWRMCLPYDIDKVVMHVFENSLDGEKREPEWVCGHAGVLGGDITTRWSDAPWSCRQSSRPPPATHRT